MQVHRSTRVAKLATQDAAATALRDVTKPFMENAEWSASGGLAWKILVRSPLKSGRAFFMLLTNS